jgi:NDP-sugar pyrophosphorylase family protein
LDAAILAAGEGKRLKPETDVLPKALLPIAGVPMLQRTILSLKAGGISRVVCVAGYKHDMVASFLAKLDFGIDVELLVVDVKSALHSFLSLSKIGFRGNFLVTTTDVVMPPEEHVNAVRNLCSNELGLVVTTRISDVNPLKVLVSDDMKVKDVGMDLAHFTHFSPGIGVIPSSVFEFMRTERAHGLRHLFEFLRETVRQGFVVRAYEVSRAVDVDSFDQLREAETLLSEQQ